VVRMPDDVDRQPPGQLDGVVAGGVVDEQDLVDPLLRDRFDRVLERLRGVVRRHDDDDLCVALSRWGGQWAGEDTYPPAPMTSLAPPEIFKAYDVRGLYGEQIDGDVAEAVGRAFVRVLAGMEGKEAAALRVGLGRDMRLTAPELAARYRDGMAAEGAHVLD